MFTPEQFTPTQWDSAEHKARFANWFVAFVTKAFVPSMFYRSRYRRLSMMWGHIAEFNQQGFYQRWLSNTEQRLHFLARTQRPTNGDPSCTFSDVEAALGAWVAASGLIDAYEKSLAGQIEANERSMLAELKAKYQG